MHAQLSNRFSKIMLHTAKYIEASKLQHRSARMDGDSPKAGGGGAGLRGWQRKWISAVGRTFIGDGSNECACAAIRSATGPDGLASRICWFVFETFGYISFSLL